MKAIKLFLLISCLFSLVSMTPKEINFESQSYLTTEIEDFNSSLVDEPISDQLNGSPLIYPKGIYEKLGDFRNKIPSKVVDIKKQLISKQSILVYNFFTEKKGKKKRVKKVFAISDGENLYINVNEMVRYFGKSSENQINDGPDYFLKAVKMGKYIYTEDYFSSVAAGVLAGSIGSISSRGLKGVIYDEEAYSFKIFKNYSKLVDFVNKRHPSFDFSGVEEESLKLSGLERIKFILSKLN